MNIALVGLETLKALYERGHISTGALIAIAPIKWLATNYPELLAQPEQAVEAIAPETRQKTCKDCIHFASTHLFCKTRIDEENTYLPARENTPACNDFEGVTLPSFLKTIEPQ